MKRTIEVLNRKVVDKVIDSYAIAGAIEAFRYIEPASTDDLDILVSPDRGAGPSGLVTLSPIITYLREKGYTEFLREGIVIEGWPVQLLPVAGALDAEALAAAAPVEIDGVAVAAGVSTRILRAEHLMANALDVGRPKDQIRLHQFIDAGAFDPTASSDILDRHGLRAKWGAFCRRFEIDDPLIRRQDP